MINPVKSFLTHGPLILKEIYTNKFQKYTHTIINDVTAPLSLSSLSSSSLLPSSPSLSSKSTHLFHFQSF